MCSVSRRFSTAIIALVLQSTVIFAQESIVLDAVRAHQDDAETKIAIPDAPSGDAAEEPPDANAERNFFAGLTAAQERDIVDRAYPLMAAKWPFNRVFVCWEDMDPAFSAQRGQVRDAVGDTWEASSSLQFLGWEKCTPGARGIRIAVRDAGPHVIFLGKYLDGRKNGMVLNFTYQNWGVACQRHPEKCNRSIAVHEFGHAIGFAHEQNRPDTPGECDKKQGGQGDNTTLTPWDLYSVMNYCNPEYNNNGVLSSFDVLAVQFIYGAD